jgi:hypothetical protein
MDWQAAMSSEIFREWLSHEIQREKTAEASAPSEAEKVASDLLEQDRVEAEVEVWRQKVAASPDLKAHFQRAKKALAENPGLVDRVDPAFVAGLELLDLES